MSYIGSDQLCHRPVFRFRCRVATKAMAKNLFTDYSEEPESEDAIKVFLRLKPNVSNESESLIEVLDSRTLLFKTPAEHVQTRRKLNMPDQYKYMFSKIFESNATQDDVFKGCVAQHIRDLFGGQHCLLFTYGTTNAGKTFTVLGNGDNPGIIPRTLTTIFKSIGNKRYKNARIMPHMFNSALEVTDKTLADEISFKNRVLIWNPDKTQADVYKSYNTTSTRSSIDEILGEPVFKQMQNRLTSDTVEVEFQADPEDRFSVWVSFAEIYNEAIYDLLQPVSHNSKRQQLKICRDTSKNFYIKGLKHVFVESEEEAYKVLRFGKNNLQVAATGINSNSSRSHCIFSIKLMKCPNVEHPERVVVSSFSICDLAGAERQKKTLNDGLRLKESQNINSSLLVLSRCFSIIRENQMANDQKLVPFRESKLTQLFQHALVGKESVTMIVNVNSEHYLYEETQHVLKASAIAKHIVVQHRPVGLRAPRLTRHSSFTRLVLQNKKNRSTMIRWDSCVKQNVPDSRSLETIDDEPSSMQQKQEQYEHLLTLVDSLKEKLKQEKDNTLKLKKSWRKKEDDIRNEMREELNSLLNKAKEQNESDRKRIAESQVIVQTRKLEEATNPHRAKQARIESINEEDDVFSLHLTPNVKDLQDEVKMQQTEIDGLTKLVEMFKEEKKELTMDLTLVKFQLGVKDREIEGLKKKMEIFGDESDLKAAYLELEKDMQEKLKQRDDLLEEARNDLLDELANNDDKDEEIKKLEQELSTKNEKIANLLLKIEDLTEDIDIKTKTIDFYELNIEELEQKCEEDNEKATKQYADLEYELSKNTQFYKTEIENLILEKNIAEEKLIKLQDEFSTYKEETDAKIEALSLKQKSENSLSTEEIKETLRKDIEDQQDERLVEVIANVTEEYELRLQELKQDLELEKAELENKCLDHTLLLERESKSKEDLTEQLQLTKDSLHRVQEELANNGKKLAELERYFESDKIKNDEALLRHTSEVSMLEKDLKKQIQETTRLWDMQREKSEEVTKLSRELTESRVLIDSLRNTLKTKEHDLECYKSKLTGYEGSLPTLQANFSRQESQLSAYKRQCEDLMSSIINMEQERSSFHNNQKEIISKYEEQLKKAKEEIESLKKEIARVTNTFYKSTPTPKKDLENQIENLKKQLDEEKTLCKKLQEEKERSTSVVKFHDTTNKENEYVFENEHQYDEQEEEPKSRRKVLDKPNLLSRLRSQGTAEKAKQHPVEDHRSTSASKTRPRRTTKAQTNQPSVTVPVPQIEITGSETEPKKPTKQTRKKLWDPESHDETSMQLDNLDFDVTVPQESPGTIVKRNLRKRNK